MRQRSVASARGSVHNEPEFDEQDDEHYSKVHVKPVRPVLP